MNVKDVAPVCRKVNVNAVKCLIDSFNRFPKIIKNFNNFKQCLINLKKVTLNLCEIFNRYNLFSTGGG